MSDLAALEKEADDLFDSLDVNHDGMLKRDELRGYMEKEFGGKVRASKVAKMFDKIDRDGNNKVTKQEFRAYYPKNKALLKNEADIREAFSVFDSDGSGSLSADELCKILTQPTDGNRPFTRAEAMALIAKFDTNGDGVLQLEEFVKAFGEVMSKAMGEAPPPPSQEVMRTMLVRKQAGQSFGLGLDDSNGVVAVVAVDPDSPGDEANLVEGDILHSVNGVKLTPTNIATLLVPDEMSFELGVIRPEA